MPESKEHRKPIIRLVVAVAENGVIGKDNTLIWHLPADLKWFKESTTGFPIIMGRKTFESVGRPLPNRRNIVITRDASYAREGIEVVNSTAEALAICTQEERVSVIGGGEIYRMFMDVADELYLTRVHHSFEGDTYFPGPGGEWKLVSEVKNEPDEKNKFPFSFMVYRKKGI
jgi:dihydrofolate reductase